MNTLEIILTAVIVATVAAALVFAVKKRKKGGCSCGCEGCAMSCEHRKKKDESNTISS